MPSYTEAELEGLVLMDPPSAGGGGHLPVSAMCVIARGGVKATALASGVAFDPARQIHVRVWTVSIGEDIKGFEASPGWKLVGIALTTVDGGSGVEREELAERMRELLATSGHAGLFDADLYAPFKPRSEHSARGVASCARIRWPDLCEEDYP